MINLKKPSCYLCKKSEFKRRSGKVRGAPSLHVIECCFCGLVTLSSTKHIDAKFYQESGMHGDFLLPVEDWLRESHWDDLRRFNMIKNILPNKRILDVGCGAGGFLVLAKELAKDTAGVEPENRIRKFWTGEINIYPNIEKTQAKYDIITAFHVFEHLLDPILFLSKLSKRLALGGQIIIEVPNADDALLTLYNCKAFQRFTYWNQHLYLFNAKTLTIIAEKAGLNVIAINHIQRYPLSNHLYWLSFKQPGGHKKWEFLDSPILMEAYAKNLASIGKTDTITAYLTLS